MAQARARPITCVQVGGSQWQNSGLSVLFLLAYICSGLAGLVYEVSWTRLLTLYIGHSTAAASTVVARSAAEIPVVTPRRASMDTVKAV